MQKLNGREHIEAYVVGRAGLGSSTRLAASSEIDRNDEKSCVGECLCLYGPTVLVEPAAMSKHDSVIAAAIYIGVHDPTIVGREGHQFLRGGGTCESQDGERYDTGV